MAEIIIDGIMRAGAYSPNHIGNDSSIFNAVAEQLRKRGCEVRIYSEEDFNRGLPEADGRPDSARIVLNMCREQRSIQRLQALEDAGALVINSGYGIENCTRERMTRILVGSGIPYPQSLTVNTDEGIVEALHNAGMERVWIKRGDGHTMHKEDVCFVRHAQEAQEVLQEFFLRGIRRAVINRHLEGDLIKFYGVAGTNFFYSFSPMESGHSKFGDETVNGACHHFGFDLKELTDMCARAARALDVVIYGGDCIVDREGQIRIIDFNDWPSFAPCRAEGAHAIAKEVLSLIKKHMNR